MKVMVGNKNYGYKNLSNDFSYTQILDHYIKNVAPKYENTSENLKLINKILGNTTKVACLVIPLAVGLPHVSFAQDLIDTQPIDILMVEGWRLILKVGGYLLLPVLGWCGWNLLASGTSPEKRTVAKNIAIYSVLGYLTIAGAPWLKDGIIHAGNWIFSKH